jgi:hypothetical protein
LVLKFGIMFGLAEAVETDAKGAEAEAGAPATNPAPRPMTSLASMSS